jgi:hypothetical protein
LDDDDGTPGDWTKGHFEVESGRDWAVIEQATGVLMVLWDVSAPDARRLLASGSRLSGRSVPEEAQAVIDELLG